MPVAYYMDHNVPQAITNGLRLRQIEVLTAYEDGYHEAPDYLLMDRATSLGRVLFTRDDDLIIVAVQKLQQNHPFSGVIYAHQLKVSIGQAIMDLELIATAGNNEELQNTIQFLPL